MKATIKVVLYVAAVFTTAFASNAPLAKNYRNKLIRLVVRFAAGGPSDVIARVMAQDMSVSLGHFIFIENRTEMHSPHHRHRHRHREFFPTAKNHPLNDFIPINNSTLFPILVM